MQLGARQNHVVVIGAGIAGLAAARTLQESGAVRVTVLEATQRVGGRAKAVSLPDGQRAELGATWLHGSQGHPVYELAVELGLMPADLKKGTNFWRGSCFAREGEAALLDAGEELAASHAVSCYAEAVDELEEGGRGSAGAHIRSKFAELHGSMPAGSRNADITRDAWGWRELLQRGIDGSDCTDDGNAAALAEYEDLPGPWGTIPGGYQRVAEAMASELDVRFGWAAAALAWGVGGVSVRSADGQQLSADAAIVTLPLGVLKERHADMFSPPLPERKREAIARMGVGVVDKLFITFLSEDETALEEHCGRAYNLLWRCDAAALSPGCEPEPGPPAIELCLQDRACSTPGEPWQHGLYSLRFGGDGFLGSDPAEADGAAEQGAGQSGRTADGQHAATAVAWIAGRSAAAMERCSDAELAAGINAALDAFPAVQLPRSFQVTRSRWGSDPCARGSYSYVPAAAQPEDVDTLAEPLTVEGREGERPVVCFAGEATSRRHIGTTTGAWLSGAQEARRLLAALEASRTA